MKIQEKFIWTAIEKAHFAFKIKAPSKLQYDITNKANKNQTITCTYDFHFFFCWPIEWRG